MKVKTTCTLKNSSVGIIFKGTIFEGTEETLPSWILSELKLNRGTLEVLAEPKSAKKRKKKDKPPAEAVPTKSASPQEKKTITLREKLSKTEK